MSNALDDIVAKMRENAEQLDKDGGIAGVYLRVYADLIEAAAKRDRVVSDALLTIQAKPIPHPDPENAPPPYPINAAALRVALEAIAGKAAKVDNIGMEYNDAVNISLDICDIARAALAAPPRNCDRFSSAKAALSMWTKVSGTERFEDWLFDAEEGGAE